MAKKIKPCPFCGAKAEYSDEMGMILCSGCGFYFECPTTLEDSLATWNMRGGEIVSKPKYKRVKAWARLIFCGTKSLETLQAQSIKHIQCQDAKIFNFDIPCTILIEAKYLKAKK